MDPRDPRYAQWYAQWYYQTYGVPYQPPQPVQYRQPAPVPQRRVVRSVETQRGLGALGNSVHLLLTVLTCGLWLFVWAAWWIVRMVIPRRRVTRSYY
ncbi:hypothetical protein [Streptomonospora nanhaiensis]|uniref:hypothetical protein n=1 Tax=Streptomonospora nanhaiensis TaxID=1323731 RepID=UPI001C37E880|nr:hypothetical protein [Streptomonospora nanhaiensis]MBV2364275.1 hypothetical protein [Streptomonospora nanhaiensis]